MLKLIATLASAAAIAGSSPPTETVTPTFSQPIPNIPGKTLLAAVVDYPPGGASLAHRHARSAFIFAYVLEGAVRSSVNGSPVRIYRAGESWSEPPGAHHSVSANVSSTKHAKLLAVFVLNSGAKDLVIPDAGHNHR